MLGAREEDRHSFGDTEMNDLPKFVRQPKPAPEPAEVESSIRTLLHNLRTSADRDTYEVLASATNTYLTALIRFTGQGVLAPKDIDSLLTVWQIMLDVGKDRVDYAPRQRQEPESE